jgi:hypothetical protein
MGNVALRLIGSKLEPFWLRLKQFCFSDGAAIHVEDGPPAANSSVRMTSAKSTSVADGRTPDTTLPNPSTLTRIPAGRTIQSKPERL